METFKIMNTEVKYISIVCEDDSIAIMQFVTRADGFTREATREEIEKEIRKTLNFKSWRIIERNEIPSDRYFRNAWIDNGKIEVDMAVAKDIHKEKLRRLREPLFAELDKQYLIADEKNNQVLKSEIISEKQKLRDITIHPAIDAASSPEELKVAAINILVK
jgi:hypothetical protein